MTRKQKQDRVNEIESFGDNILNLNKADLISTLRDYVDCLDRIGVNGKPGKIADILRKQYKCVTKLSDTVKKAHDRDSLFLCIIGNVIYSNGKPNSNIMSRFCEEYLTPEVDYGQM